MLSRRGSRRIRSELRRGTLVRTQAEEYAFGLVIAAAIKRFVSLARCGLPQYCRRAPRIVAHAAKPVQLGPCSSAKHVAHYGIDVWKETPPPALRRQTRKLCVSNTTPTLPPHTTTTLRPPHLHVPHSCTAVHMHTCPAVHMHTCTHAHMHTSTHAHMHTCTHAHMHTYTRMHARTLHLHR
jgi:hypothetical protein